MLNDFKEWLSDNLRYILLGLAGILILVIAFFAIRLISGLGSSKETETETEIVTEAETETKVIDSAEVQLVKNVPEVLGLIEKYYTARNEKDYATLASICEDFDQAKIESEDAAVESYNNYMTYSKPGLTEGSYVVYIYVEMKLTGIDTQAPSLLQQYVLPDSEGNLMLAEVDRSTEIKEYAQEMQTDADVQALIQDVTDAYETAMENDENLANFVAAQSSGSSDNSTSGDSAGDDTTAAATTGTMQATTEVNVRGSASADATLYGVLTTGQQVEVLENLDVGWSKIRYTVNGTTIEGYVMTQYLGAVQ